ncbi:MAG TPA: adenylate/guanylate cyclase domain-containing protein [Roseiflexaceae bacterium]|nr:adenylate/guanylate cyclase domain-containing protein [Roseiflexaceae bacterium]
MAFLIVDDAATDRFALALMLDDAGYSDLLQAGSAAEAIACLAERSPDDVELILTDLNMPGVNGIAACQQIKALPMWSDIPIIMVTGSDEVNDLSAAFAAGAIDYITKPANAVELLARVRSAVRLKHEMDSRKARERDLEALNQQLEEVLADLAEQHTLLQREQAKSEQLLLNLLPPPIAERLKQAPGIIADRFEAVTVLFADIVGFTELAASVAPEALVSLLNEVFSCFDQLAEQYGLEKIKTIGDSYMAVGGLPMPRPDHATAVARMAIEMQTAVQALSSAALNVRIGIHSGPVVAGVIGQKKFSYDLWGDTVNVASRMESHGQAGAIQVSAATYQLIQHAFRCAARGRIQVKGKGAMEVWHILGPKTEPATAQVSEPHLALVSAAVYG